MGGKIVILAALIVPLMAARAEEEMLPSLKVNDITYTNVTVTKVTATDVYFTSSNGIANAKLKDLDRKTQKHFHYSASKARAAERQEAADAEQYHLQSMRNFPSPSSALFPADTQTNPPVSNDGKPIWARAYLNHQGPDLQVEQWLTSVPDTRGKFILYDFWSAASPVCRAEIPELNAFQQEFSDRLVIVAISDEPEKTVRPVTDPVAQFSVAIDTQDRTKTEVGVTGVPHLILMDPKGFVRWEGFPFLPGHEFSNRVLTDVIAQYDKETHDLEGAR
jgi:cytochrome c biogenesis protein CcmG, thiol:disulfide interchange protein DsbE